MPRAELPNATLGQLLELLHAGGLNGAFISDSSLATWPATDVAALQACGLLRLSKAATSAECPGCEEACVRPIEVLRFPGQPPAHFILCPLREDISSVRLTEADVSQWQLTPHQLADVIAQYLGTARAVPMSTTPLRLRLGWVPGRTGKEWVFLDCTDAGLSLNVAGHELAPAEVLELKADVLTLNMNRLRRCVDSPRDAPPGEAVEARATRIRARIAELKQQGVRKFLEHVAKEERVSKCRIQQVLKQAEVKHSTLQATWSAPITAARTPIKQAGKMKK